MKTALQLSSTALCVVWTAVGIWLLAFAWADRREQQALRARQNAALRHAPIESDDVEYGVGA